MKKFFFLVILLAAAFATNAFSQSNPAMAKAEYQLAEQAFSKADYPTTINHLDSAVKHSGRENQLTHYLRIMALSEFTKENFFIMDTLTGRMNNFFNDPVTKKLDAVRYKEIEQIRNQFRMFDADQKLKEAQFKDVRSLTNYIFTIGTNLNEMEKTVGSKKIKTILRKKLAMPLALQAFDLLNKKVETFQVASSLIAAQDITTNTGISGTPNDKLFKAVTITDQGLLIDEKNKIVAHVYAVSSNDKSDITASLMKDLGRPYLTQKSAEGVLPIWKFGTLYIAYTFFDGEHAVLMYRTEILK